MKKALLVLSVLGTLLSGTIAYGQYVDDSASAFRRYIEIRPQNIKVPTVVEVNLDDESMEYYQSAVLSNATGEYQPTYFKRTTAKAEQDLNITANNIEGDTYYLIDDDLDTSVDFELPETNQGKAIINITSTQPFTSSSFTILLDNHVALPNQIAIYAMRNGREVTVVAPQRMQSRTVDFLETNSSNWRVELTYGQPLRISELRISQDSAGVNAVQRLRFLAYPEESYTVYIDTDRNVNLYLPEGGNLVSNVGVLFLPKFPSFQNPQYVEADIDFDGVPDIRDNCTDVENKDQEDIDQNGRGDACDDFDRDGIINNIDNCVDKPNQRQLDTDEDGIGDICDGEESRFTEKYKWIPWIGIGFAAIILVFLFFTTARSAREKNI